MEGVLEELVQVPAEEQRKEARKETGRKRRTCEEYRRRS